MQKLGLTDAVEWFRRVGREGDFGGPYRQLEMNQAELHYL
jgi:hypothetical protein